MKTETTQQPTSIPHDKPDPPNPPLVAAPEEQAPTGHDVDPAVKAGMEYLFRKNAGLYRRLAE